MSSLFLPQLSVTIKREERKKERTEREILTGRKKTVTTEKMIKYRTQGNMGKHKSTVGKGEKNEKYEETCSLSQY